MSGDGLQTAMSVWLVVLGMVLAVASWLRWARAERAMRRHEPLPSTPVGAVVAAGVLVVGILFLLAQRTFVRGMMGGAVKG